MSGHFTQPFSCLPPKMSGLGPSLHKHYLGSCKQSESEALLNGGEKGSEGERGDRCKNQPSRVFLMSGSIT